MTAGVGSGEVSGYEQLRQQRIITQDIQRSGDRRAIARTQKSHRGGRHRRREYLVHSGHEGCSGRAGKRIGSLLHTLARRVRAEIGKGVRLDCIEFRGVLHGDRQVDLPGGGCAEVDGHGAVAIAPDRVGSGERRTSNEPDARQAGVEIFLSSQLSRTIGGEDQRFRIRLALDVVVAIDERVIPGDAADVGAAQTAVAEWTGGA